MKHHEAHDAPKTAMRVPITRVVQANMVPKIKFMTYTHHRQRVVPNLSERQTNV